MRAQKGTPPGNRTWSQANFSDVPQMDPRSRTEIKNKTERKNMSGFKKFLLRGNVVDLAVAVVIGTAFGAAVNALIKDLITPIISAFGGLPDFSRWAFTVNGRSS
jgi:hypothetical protein